MFVLEALDEQTTRLIERLRADYKPHLRLAPIVYLLAEPGGRNESGHARPCDRDHVKENVGLCSTYSIRTRSGPHRNAA